jgi:class 3 adenylate cyclase/tetratricopeptide (TPR) repeat protein
MNTPMRCPKCQAANLADAQFCEACGVKLEVVCPSCGTSASATARFCRKCGAAVAGPVSNNPQPLAPSSQAPKPAGPHSYTPKHLAEKILTSRSALEGERKQVTVLFADIKGSMDLQEGVDPEEWHRIIDRFFVILTDGVHRFEGTINQYTGDGIMALFGAPIAHEDHAQRACYAALHLRDELRRYADELRVTQGLNFSVRMGLNSGEVVVGKIGDDLRMDYTAQGHTVGLAARMEQLAEAGKVLLTEHTAKFISGLFTLRDLGPSSVKGVRVPIHVYELEDVGRLRTRFDVARARGLSRFVGRADEMTTLEAALAQALQGQGRVVGVVAEAGTGKSRLCFEFAERCRARGLVVNEAHAVAHGKSIPFLPVLEMLRDIFDISEQDADRTAREKIAGRLLLLARDFEDTLPFFFDFLGIPDPERPVPNLNPDERQRRLFSILRRLVHARSQREPVVMLIEDLHWIDAASDMFLERLVEAISGTRTLLLVNFRPEYHAGWMQKSSYQQLPLLPLGREAVGELLSHLLGADAATARLKQLIEERTGGNPFFIEEVVRSLFDQSTLVREPGARGRIILATPVEEIQIPSSVQAVLAARIDRRPEHEKQVLQTAAVIGKVFAEPVLRRVGELPEPDLAAALRGLVAAEFLDERALYPEAEYAFRHPLTQEMAYRSQLGERRARVHAAVARVIAELYAGKLDERAALLAHHCEAAGDMLEAARWSRRAAEWVGLSNFPEALRHWRKVRALIEGLPESPETRELGATASAQIFALGIRLGMSGEEPAALLAELKALADEKQDQRLRATMLAAPAVAAAMGGQAEGAVEPLREATRLADETEDPGLKLALRAALVIALFFSGRLREALALIDETLAAAPAVPELGSDIFGFSPFIMLLMFRAQLLRHRGRLEDSARALDRATALAQEHGQLEILVATHQASVDLAWFTGDARGAMEHARRAVEAAEALGSAFSRSQAYGALSLAYRLDEQWDEAAAACEQSLAILRDSRTGIADEGFKMAGLAEVYLHQGRKELARTTAEEAVTFASRYQRVAECYARLILARVLLVTEGARAADAVQESLTHALALVEETGAISMEPPIRVELAELARLRGDEAGRQRELGEAQRLFTAIGAPLRAEQIAKDLG